MRTTLSIDDDVLAAAKELASQQHKSVGEVISSLTRQALRPPLTSSNVRNGMLLLPMRPDATAVTQELVNQMRDELPG